MNVLFERYPGVFPRLARSIFQDDLLAEGGDLARIIDQVVEIYTRIGIVDIYLRGLAPEPVEDRHIAEDHILHLAGLAFVDLAGIDRGARRMDIVHHAVFEEHVVDQFKGKAVPAKAEPGEFAVINLSDMTSNGIAYDNLKTFSEERRKLLRFLLEDGDVLIASKGTVQKVAVFEDQGKREVVASSNITVLRPKEKLRGFYIKFFLETEIGRAYLDYADKGKAVLNLSTADLLDIKIPEIPIVKQDYQIAAYLRGRADYHRKMVRAEQEWENIQQNVTEALFGN